MEILQHTKEHRRFRQRVRTFMEKEMLPYADQWEENRILPRSFWQRMGEEGFLCTNLSPEYGGMGGNFLHSVIVLEEFLRANHNEQGVSGHSDICVPYINSYASEEIKNKYLPKCVSGEIITAIAMTEPNTGSDVAGIATTAEEIGDEVIINGSKIFITCGILCDLVILAAKDSSATNQHQAISLYLVETGTPGFKKGKKLDKMGMHSQDTAELFFSDCRVPIENRLGQKGQGFKMLMEKLQQERLILTIAALSAAEYILDKTMELFKSNSGPGKMIPKSQVNQFALVEMATEIKLGRTFLDKLIADHMEARDVVIETSMAKYWVAEMVRRVADRSLDLLGDFATLEACPVVRAWRDIRSFSIVGGTNEIMKKIVAKLMVI